MNLHPITFRTSMLLVSVILAGCGSPEQKEAYYIKHGNELFDKGEFEKARIEYKNAARIKPTDPEVTYRFGLVDEAEGDIRGAFVGFTQAEQQDAHFHPALLKLAEYYLAAGQLDQAQKRIGVILSDAPDDANGHAMRAALLLRQKDLSGAEKDAHFALEKDPKNVAAFLVLIALFEEQNNDAKAISTAEDGITHNPKNLPLLLAEADIYDRKSDLPNIAKIYQTIFQAAPDKPQYRAKLALIYLNAGKLDDVEATLRAGVAALPDDWDMKHQLVTFLGDHRSMDAAEKEIRSYIQSNPQKTDLNAWLVDLYLSHNATDRAITFLNQIIADGRFDRQGLDARTIMARIDYVQGNKSSAENLTNIVLQNDPNNVDALFIKAHIEVDNGFLQNAVTDLRTIIRDQPKAKEALHLLSETLFLQGHIDLAIDTLGQLVDLDPLNFAARVRLAQMHHMNHDTKHAMDILFFVTKTEPQYALGWETTARVAIDSKDWSSAETAIDKLDKIEGQHLTAVFLRGQLLANTGKAKEAIDQYTQVIDADPASPLAEYAMESLVFSYKSLGQPEEASRYIASLKTNSPMVHTILGESRLAAGKSDEAASDFDAAIASHTTRQEPYLDRARMYLFSHNTNQALDILKEGAAAAPADLRAPLMEAQIYSEAGRYQDAIAIYDSLLARNSELDVVANNLAEIIADYVYQDPAALAKAQHIAERFIASSDPLLLDTLAWVYYRQDNNQQAQSIMQRAFSQRSDLPPQVHYHYAAILLKAGRKQQAKTELDQAVAGDDHYPGRDDAKKMLLAP